MWSQMGIEPSFSGKNGLEGMVFQIAQRVRFILSGKTSGHRSFLLFTELDGCSDHLVVVFLLVLSPRETATHFNQIALVSLVVNLHSQLLKADDMKPEGFFLLALVDGKAKFGEKHAVGACGHLWVFA